jgi:hypothetical protein
MFERLIEKGHEIGARKVARASGRLSEIALPNGIVAERQRDGIVLSGKRLRMRFVRDAKLRSFADAVKGNL